MSKVKDLVEYIVKGLADKPDAVNLSEIEGESSIVLELRVDPEDMGRMIGPRRADDQRDVFLSACLGCQDGQEGNPGDRIAMTDTRLGTDRGPV